MKKNIKGGKNFKKQKKDSSSSRELIFCEEDQIYGRIIKKLGDGRFDCELFNSNLNKNIIGKICGSMRKRVWINNGNIVLLSIRNFDSSCCDIIHKYNDEEAQNLKNYGEIPSNINLMATNLELADGKFNDNEEFFTFDNI